MKLTSKVKKMSLYVHLMFIFLGPDLHRLKKRLSDQSYYSSTYFFLIIANLNERKKQKKLFYQAYDSFDSLFQCLFIFHWKYFSKPFDQLSLKSKFFEEILEYIIALVCNCQIFPVPSSAK